jgi:hypothetical protein
MVGARVLLFGAVRTQYATQELAKRRGLSSITLPVRCQEFWWEIDDALRG